MTERSAEQIKADNIAKMGEPLGSIYSAVWQETTRIYRNWLEYVELFGTKPERIILINKAAPAFFGMLQDELWELLLLQIARMTDPPKTFGKSGRENLTLRALPPLIDDPSLYAKVSALIDDAVNRSAFCRDWRNRQIAHRDLGIALERSSIPLAEASRLLIREALQAVEDVLNAIEGHYFNSETHFSRYIRIGGVKELLYVLDDGITAEAKRRERVERGEYTPEDLARRNL